LIMSNKGFKRDDKKIEEARAYLQNIIDAIPDFLLVLDKDLRIKIANRSFYEKFQTEIGKVRGRSIAEILPDKEGKLSSELTKLFGDSQPTKLFRTKDRVKNFELYYNSEKLGKRIFNIIARIISTEGEKEELVILRDITERKLTEKELRESRANLRNIIKKNADGIIIVDRKGVIRFVNPAAKALFGRDEEELIGEMFGFPLVAGETTEIEIIRRDGEVAIAEMRVVEMEWEGEIVYLASLRDITDRKLAEKEIQLSHDRLQKILHGTIKTLSSTIEKRDFYTAGHQQRVSFIARAIATKMGLPQEKIEGLYTAALLHDIGKIIVPSEILSKPGRLSQIEFSIIKEHPQVGYEILKDVDFPWPIAEIILQHHERMDGSGYPQGLTGNDILLEARILAVADVVEAISSHRPYRPALGIDKALEEISKNKGKLYDPQVVDACLGIVDEIKKCIS